MGLNTRSKLESAYDPTNVAHIANDENRHRMSVLRRLPSSKGTTTPSVDCKGTWKTIELCNTETGKKTLKYEVTVARSGNGAPCPNTAGETSVRPCAVDCQGSWTEYDNCNEVSGFETSTYEIEIQPKNDGKTCHHVDCDNVDDCKDGEKRFRECDVDCKGAWSDFSPCDSATGQQSAAYEVLITNKRSGAACSDPKCANEMDCKHGEVQHQECAVDCTGEWEPWSFCRSGLQHRRFFVQTTAKNAGKECDISDGTISTRNCTDYCDGAFGSWSPCHGEPGKSTGIQSRVYKAEGEKCSIPDGFTEKRTCTVPVITVAWDYAVPKDKWNVRGNHSELRMIACPKGSFVNFTWNPNMHDIWKFSSEDSYLRCNFTGAEKRAERQEGSFLFYCDHPGTHYFACNINGACPNGKQRLRVQVTQPNKTKSLRDVGIPTQAQLMEDALISLGYGEFFSEEQALELIEKLKLTLKYAPHSCSDWLPEFYNSNATCSAWINTDLGFLYRSKPNADYDLAQHYYDQALEISPNLCLASSYLVELSIQQNDKVTADQRFEKACLACGHAHLDMVFVRAKYRKNNWKLPNGTSCSNFIPLVGAKKISPPKQTCTNVEDALITCRRIRKNWAWTCDNAPYSSRCSEGYVYDSEMRLCRNLCD